MEVQASPGTDGENLPKITVLQSVREVPHHEIRTAGSQSQRSRLEILLPSHYYRHSSSPLPMRLVMADLNGANREIFLPEKTNCDPGCLPKTLSDWLWRSLERLGGAGIASQPLRLVWQAMRHQLVREAPGFPDNPPSPFPFISYERGRPRPRITGHWSAEGCCPVPRKNLPDRAATRCFSFIIEASVTESLVIKSPSASRYRDSIVRRRRRSVTHTDEPLLPHPRS